MAKLCTHVVGVSQHHSSSSLTRSRVDPRVTRVTPASSTTRLESHLHLPRLAPTLDSLLQVEMVHSAVADAQANAAANSLTNATFIAGRAEDALAAAIAQHKQQVGRVACSRDA